MPLLLIWSNLTLGVTFPFPSFCSWSYFHFFFFSGFKPAKHMVFSGLYPADGSDFDALNHAIERLTCNDASVSVTKESSTALGLGFR